MGCWMIRGGCWGLMRTWQEAWLAIVHEWMCRLHRHCL